MYRLPLFPLPLVLFPGMPLPLHVFEPRYRRMVARCLEGDRRFGLVYHDPDRSGPFRPEAGPVGCVAEIGLFQPLPDGRSLMLVQGAERFRLVDGIESDEPYFEGLAEDYPDAAPSDAPPEGAAEAIRLFRQVVEQLDEDPPEVPPLEPHRAASFQIASRIRTEPVWQQQLLESRSEAERLQRLVLLLRAVLDDPE